MFIIISRLPKAELMIEAIDKMNQRSVSTDSLTNLLTLWPHDTYDDLMAEYAQDPKAEWAKTEAYFIKLGEKKKFDVRIKIWLYKINFEKIAGLIIT